MPELNAPVRAGEEFRQIPKRETLAGRCFDWRPPAMMEEVLSPLDHITREAIGGCHGLGPLAEMLYRTQERTEAFLTRRKEVIKLVARNVAAELAAGAIEEALRELVESYDLRNGYAKEEGA